MTEHAGSGTEHESGRSDPFTGSLFGGKYRVGAMIAKGGMGRVYRAVQEPLGRSVALKLLMPPRELHDDPQYHKRFLLEAATLGKLKHPNTVTVFDYGHEEELDVLYMVMELVEGENLGALLKKRGFLAVDHALRIVYEVARSLSEAHEHGIVHRDLKPSNLMLVQTSEGESVKVVDFGIVKVRANQDDELTRADRIVGSPRYMAPEQIRHDVVDGRTDIYAIGVLLYEMIVGAPPFRGKTPLETLVAHLQHPVPEPVLPEGTPPPPAVEAILKRCLAKKMDARYPDVEALKVAVRGALAELGRDITGSEVRPFPRGDVDMPTAPTLREVTPAAPAEKGRFDSFGAFPGVLIGITIAVAFGAVVVFGWRGDADVATPDLVEAEPDAIAPRTDDARAAPVPAAPAFATVVITSDPSGAEVSVDGERVGATPHTLKIPAASPAPDVWLSLDGYVPQQLSDLPEPGQEDVREVRLKRKAVAPVRTPAGSDLLMER